MDVGVPGPASGFRRGTGLDQLASEPLPPLGGSRFKMSLADPCPGLCSLLGPQPPPPLCLLVQKGSVQGGMCTHTRTHTHTRGLLDVCSPHALCARSGWHAGPVSSGSFERPRAPVPPNALPVRTRRLWGCLQRVVTVQGRARKGVSVSKSLELLGQRVRIICDVARWPAERAPAVAFLDNRGKQPCLAGTQGNPFICPPSRQHRTVRGHAHLSLEISDFSESMLCLGCYHIVLFTDQSPANMKKGSSGHTVLSLTFLTSSVLTLCLLMKTLTPNV